MDLNDRLKAIKVPVSITYSTDGSSQVESWVHLADAEIAQIHEAFLSEGYMQPRDWKYVDTNNKLRLVSLRVGDTVLMTGAEWYDRFLDEFHELPVEDYKNGHAWLKIARIAAGINETKEQN